MTTTSTRPGLAGLTDDHRRAISSGAATVADVAAELGVSRQAVHARLRREARRAGGAAPATTGPVSAAATPPAPPPAVPGATSPTDPPPSPGELASNAALWLLARLHRIAADPAVNLSPAACRQHALALASVTDTLTRLGELTGPDAADLPVLSVRVLNDAEEDELRAKVERDFAEAFDTD